jgi:hypothetical protein
MNTLPQVNNRIHWPSAVTVRIGFGLPEYIHDPEAALHYITTRWPPRDWRYTNAKEACIAAIEEMGSSEVAREAFIAAAIAAGLLA